MSTLQLTMMREGSVLFCLSLLLASSWTSLLHNHDHPAENSNCGLSKINHHLDSRGEVIKRNFPWMAALYHFEKQSWDQYCGGTLISSRLVLTAAHCVVVTGTGRMLTADEVQVGLGKKFRNYYRNESAAEILHVKEILVQERYLSQEQYFELDIALLVLKRSVASTSYIVPACVPWNGFRKLADNETGYLSGWGITEDGTSSAKLQFAYQKFIEFKRCKTMLDSVNRKYITQDKICVSDDEGGVGGVADRGDSGGGLMMKRGDIPGDERFYVYGVLSTKIYNDSSSVRLYTDVQNAIHSHWLWPLFQQQSSLLTNTSEEVIIE